MVFAGVKQIPGEVLEHLDEWLDESISRYRVLTAKQATTKKKNKPQQNKHKGAEC